MTANRLSAGEAFEGDLLELASKFLDDPLLTRKRLSVLAAVSANGERLGWSEARRVEGVRIALALSPMAAHRLYHCLTREEAVATIAGLAQEHLNGKPEEPGAGDGGPRTVRVGVEDLDNWEAGRVRVPATLLKAVCEAYRTRPDRIGYRDYTPTREA
ncbi:MAG: hypothetical protein ACJ73S_30445 [Mycobacteriales bacterium]